MKNHPNEDGFFSNDSIIALYLNIKWFHPKDYSEFQALFHLDQNDVFSILIAGLHQSPDLGQISPTLHFNCPYCISSLSG